MVLAYARVSSREQSNDSQIVELKKYGYDEIFLDKVSGKVFLREGLEKLLSKVREDDVLVVFRLDRLGRSMIEILNLVADLRLRKVQLVSISDGVDTRTAVGLLMVGLMATLAEYEFSLLKERQRAGITARKLKGLPTGRPEGLSSESKVKASLVKDLYDLKRYSISEIMVKTEVKSRATVYKYLRIHGIDF